MKDIQIRSRLKAYLEKIHASEPDALIIDELEVCGGQARADVVVVNGELNGFEIKSDKDTLMRFQNQVFYYEKVFERLTFVCGKSHLDQILELAPSWSGIVCVTRQGNELMLQTIQKSGCNPSLCGISLAQFLWREELIFILEACDALHGLKSKPRIALQKRLAEVMPPNEIAENVRKILKQRRQWRVD